MLCYALGCACLGYTRLNSGLDYTGAALAWCVGYARLLEYAMLYYAMPDNVINYVLLCYSMLGYVLPCYAIPGHSMLC